MAIKRLLQRLNMTLPTVQVADAAQMLCIGKTKVYELIAEHEIEVLKVGSATLIVVGSLAVWTADLDKSSSSSGTSSIC